MAIAEEDKWIASRLSHSQGKLLSIRGGSHEEIVSPNHFIRDDFGLRNADDFLFLNKLPYG